MKQSHLGIAALGLLASASPMAQSADTDNSKTVQEAVVTATRRAENVQKGVSAQTDYSWKDKVYWQPGNPYGTDNPYSTDDAYSTDNAYGILNASVGVTPPDSHYRTTGFARNLLEEDTFGRVTALAFGNGYVRVPTCDTQRVFGIAANMDF